MKGVVTIGEALGVLSSEAVGRIESGSLMSLHVAGAELNAAIALSRLGVPTQFAGAVGSDAVGRLVRRVLRAEGVGVENLQTRDDAPTGLMMKEWYGLANEPRIFYYRRDTAMHAWDPQQLRLEPGQLDWLHITGITLMIQEALSERILRWLGQWSGELSVDLNVRHRLGPGDAWRTRLEQLLPRASLVFASQSELVELWGSDRSDVLIDRGVIRPEQSLIVTDGANGAWVQADGQEMGRVAAWPVARVVDVVGAGDGFAAGVLAGRYRGWDWASSLRLGSLVGAFAVAHPGDFEGYPEWQDVQAMWEGDWIDR